jgi:hypothetical protein
MYDFFGYYGVCWVAGEVKEAGRPQTIARSIQISILAILICNIMTDLSVLSVIGWQEMVSAPVSSDVIGSVGAVFFLRASGGNVFLTSVLAVIIALTAFGSGFSLLLGYSRVPAAAAAAAAASVGTAPAVQSETATMPDDDAAYQLMPSWLGHQHVTLGFPDYSLLLVSGMSVLCCFFSFGDLVQALITVRIVVQFMAQIFVFARLKTLESSENSENGCTTLDWVAAVYAAFGWFLLLCTAETRIIWLCLGIVGSGVVVYMLHSTVSRTANSQ